MNWSTDKWQVFDYSYAMEDLTPTVVYEDSLGTRKTETVNFPITGTFNIKTGSQTTVPTFTDIERGYWFNGSGSGGVSEYGNDGRLGAETSYPGQDEWSLLFSDPEFTFDPRFFGFPKDHNTDEVASDFSSEGRVLAVKDFFLGRVTIPVNDVFKEKYRPARTNFFFSSGNQQYNTYKTSERTRYVLRGKNIPAPYVFSNRYDFNEITSVVDTSENDIPESGISTLQTFWEEAYSMVPDKIFMEDSGIMFWEQGQSEDFRSIISDTPGSSGEFYDYEIRLIA